MNQGNASIIAETLLQLIPADGSSIGNQTLRARLAEALGHAVTEAEYEAARDRLIARGALLVGKGRGGSVRRVADGADLVDAGEGFQLEQQVLTGADSPRAARSQPALPSSAPPTATRAGDDKQVTSYRHAEKRRNNPEVGMVTPDTDPEAGKARWAYDPHIDPALEFDTGRARVETLIDDALASGDPAVMRAALEQLKRQSAPYLNWTGKAERTSFELDTVSLHVHERIDPMSILSAVRKAAGTSGKGRDVKNGGGAFQYSLFNAPFENLPLRDAIDFYKHERGWANRLITGDSLLVMNSLLQKEGMAGQVQTIYIDPPYGIKYGSNFQPFVNKRDVKDRKDEDLTQEPEMIKAFRDTWELGIHSYLTYLRDRLLLAKELLRESGSVFVQIGDENVHLVRNVLDEVFDADNFVAEIFTIKTSSATSETLAGVADVVLFYARDKSKLKYRQLYTEKTLGEEGTTQYTWLVSTDRSFRRRMTAEERADPKLIPKQMEVFAADNLTSQRPPGDFPVGHQGREFVPGKGYWKTHKEGFNRLSVAGRLEPIGNTLMYRRLLSDFAVSPINNVWRDVLMTGFSEDKVYVVQTGQKTIERCLLMATDPSDLVLDPTCGSGTTAFVAEKWGRRWITCDTSRVAVTLAKQRLMTASYDYYELKYPQEGLKSGFIYKTVPHVTLKSIANNPEIDEIYERMHPTIEAVLAELNKALAPSARPSSARREGAQKEWEVPFDFPADWPDSARKPFDAFHAARLAMQKMMDESITGHADQETLYDQPAISKDKLRITGPFTVEAVPFPTVLALENAEQTLEADASIARFGESARQHQWRDELLKTGIRGKGGQMLRFAEMEALPGTRYLHCSGTIAETGERVVVSFGPEHAALEQRQVEMAMREAGELFPRPKMIVFCAFTFDPEAAKDIDQTKGIIALKAQMNTDLLTEDLKKARASNQSFWLMGQPDVEVRKLNDGRYQVEVHGFDYFDTLKGELVSGGKAKIAAWMLDTDYDDRSLLPRQVFFPMAGAKDGWQKLKKDIKAELDESKLDKFHSTVGLPFEAGDNRKIAVKIIDDRGVESLRVIALD